MQKRIVWGTCWLNEPVDMLVEFFNSSIKSLNLMGFEVIPIVFHAKYEQNHDDINFVKENIKDIIIIYNKINIFPNKNYGVALITKMAMKCNSPYLAIVDSDWNIKENYSFVKKMLDALINGNKDIIIPNIGDSSGRSNILIGKTVLTLFYPDYREIIETAFPGSVIGLTSKLYNIISSPYYHFDWGGEWDIISLAIHNKMNIDSVLVDVKNIRHRNNKSKMNDSFQIWRAILGNNDMIKRSKYLKEYGLNNRSNIISKYPLSEDTTTDELISLFENGNKTERQVLYMILYPIAFLTGQLKEIPIIETSNGDPYDKEELKKISDVAIYCAYLVLKDCDFSKVIEICNSIKGDYLSEWNIEIQNQLLNNLED